MFVSASVFTMFILVLIVIITLTNVRHTRTFPDILNIRMPFSHSFGIPVDHKMVGRSKISLEHSFLVDGTLIEAIIQFCVEVRSLRNFW